MTTTERQVTIIDLADPESTSDEMVGGKAAGLARSVSRGLPVPEGCIIPSGAADADLDRLAAAVGARFAGRRLAVRSSAIGEDDADASFAGQFETVLDVPAEAGSVAGAARRVRASVGADHVASYGRGIDRRMAVLIMPMIEPDAAGIAFTRDPVTGDRRTIIEAVPGLADELAAGTADPERWIVDTVPTRDTPDLGALTPAQAVAVADLAARVEAAEGCPQDIEWALRGDELLLLQARPVTTLDDVEPIPLDDAIPPGPWEWDAAHNRLPMTPLTASVFCPGFVRGSRLWAAEYGAPLDRLEMRTINGYLYVQVVPPMGKPSPKAPPAWLMRLMFKIAPSLRRREQTAKRAFETRRDQHFFDAWYETERPRIIGRLDTWFDLDLSALSEGDLADHVLDAAELQRETFNWNQVSDLGYLIPLADLHWFLGARLDTGLDITIRLLSGSTHPGYRESLADLSALLRESADAQLAVGEAGDDVLERLEVADPEFADAFRGHQRRYGARVLGFDLIAPTQIEHPEAELGRLLSLPEVADQIVEADRLAADLRERLSGADVAEFDALLAEARRTYPIREDGEAVDSLAFGYVRRAALEAGRRLHEQGYIEDAEHVVFLTLDELVECIRSPHDVGRVVRTRRGERAWALAHPPQTFLGGATGADVDPSMFPPNVARFMRVMNLVLAHDSRPADLEAGADGVGASPGVYTGPVRVVRGPGDFSKVREGDVLVAPITTSPWEVLFAHIGGLVTEAGGMLSHPAIVAREYGIPAVLGVANATEDLRDGRLVTVDGSAGTVSRAR